MKQLTKKQAIRFAESGQWKDFTDDEVVRFQLFQDKLCMDFERFHEALEKVLGRPVYTHEFASSQLLEDEYLGNRKAPTFEEIIALIPDDKLVIILGDDDDYSD